MYCSSWEIELPIVRQENIIEDGNVELKHWTQIK